MVPTNKLKGLGNEQDGATAAREANELIAWYKQEEADVMVYLARHEQAGREAKIEEEELAQQERSELQVNAESGSFSSLEQLAENIRVQVLTLSDIKDFGECKKTATKIILQERSMIKGPRAYADTKKLDLGSQRDEDATGKDGKKLPEEQPDIEAGEPYLGD